MGKYNGILPCSKNDWQKAVTLRTLDKAKRPVKLAHTKWFYLQAVLAIQKFTETGVDQQLPWPEGVGWEQD